MMNRVPTLLYEGAPNYPTMRGRARRSLLGHHRPPPRHALLHRAHRHPHVHEVGRRPPAKHDLSSLRILGTVGEPINPEAWMWYHKHIGKGRCPIVDTYWQTETGGHVVTPLPGAIPTKPGSCTLPMFGIDAAVVNEQGQELPPNKGGLFVIRKPWPGMLRGVYGNRDRFVSNYWGRVKDPTTGVPYYFSADGARRDEDGYFWIQGRIDDVIKVSGHLLGTMEVESALVSHPAVAEAAVVGMPHEIKGNAICAFVTLKTHWLIQQRPHSPMTRCAPNSSRTYPRKWGRWPSPIRSASPKALPKTRSGKIMRRLLRDVAAGVEKITQDTTTLEDFQRGRKAARRRGISGLNSRLAHAPNAR
jgi:acetyl-CoA synthetase